MYAKIKLNMYPSLSKVYEVHVYLHPAEKIHVVPHIYTTFFDNDAKNKIPGQQ